MKLLKKLVSNFSEKFNYGRITDPYCHLETNYGRGWQLVEKKEIESFKPLNMNDFPGDKHCSLVSLTSIFSYYRKQGFRNIPDEAKLFKDILELASRKLYYNKRLGTKPIFISLLGRDIWRLYGYEENFKNRLFIFNDQKMKEELKDTIDKGNPAALSFVLGDYKLHTVSYYGYLIFKKEAEEKVYLLINDNWSQEKVYIDFSRLAVSSKNIFMFSRKKVQA